MYNETIWFIINRLLLVRCLLATIMVVVYPIGIPLLFYLLLYKCKNEIIERDDPIGDDNILAREDMTPIERYQQAENDVVHVFQNPIVRVKQVEMAVLEK